MFVNVLFFLPTILLGFVLEGEYFGSKMFHGSKVDVSAFFLDDVKRVELHINVDDEIVLDPKTIESPKYDYEQTTKQLFFSGGNYNEMALEQGLDIQSIVVDEGEKMIKISSEYQPMWPFWITFNIDLEYQDPNGGHKRKIACFDNIHCKDGDVCLPSIDEAPRNCGACFDNIHCEDGELCLPSIDEAPRNCGGEVPLTCKCSCLKGNSSAPCGGPNGKGSCTDGPCQCVLSRFCSNGCFKPKTETLGSCYDDESPVEYLQRIR